MSAAPEVAVETGRTVPAWALRAVGALLVTAMLLVALAQGWHVNLALVIVSAAVGCAVMVQPWTGTPALAVGAAGVVLLVGGPGGLLAVMALVLLGHLVLWVSGFAARTSWDAAVEVAVLRAEMRSAAVIQAGAQVLAVVAVLLSGVEVGSGDLWRALAVLGAIGLTVAVLPREA